MKTKSIITIIASLALASCLTVAFTPCAYAASDAALAVDKAAITTQATAKPKAPSGIKLISRAMGEISLRSDVPNTYFGDDYSYTVRYSYNKNMKGAKTKTSPYCSMNINKMKKGKRVYVQIRTNVKDGDTTLHSAWSKKKSVKVDSKHKYTYTLLKKPKYFNSWDECWAYCKKQPEVSVFMQGYIKLVKKVNGKWVDDTPSLYKN